MRGDAPADARSRPGRSVTSRVVAILDAFDATTPRLTLTRIAQHTGLPTSTVHRLVVELEAGGVLERDVRGGYRLGPRLRALGLLAGDRPAVDSARHHS